MPLVNAYYRVYHVFKGILSRCLDFSLPEILDSLSQLPPVIKKEGLNKVLIVTDPGLIKVGVVAKAEEALKEGQVPYELFGTVEPNPSVTTCESALNMYKETGCDGLLAIGGGSAMDTAKAVAARVAKPKKTLQQLGGLFKVGSHLPMLMVVPTTAGTGSEATLASVIVDRATKHKYALYDPHLIPSYAVHDASLTVGLPPFVTATTGMDALTHAVEAYLSRLGNNTQRTVDFSRNAVKLIFENLEKVYAHGDDLEGRKNMLTASLEAGAAFTYAGVGNVHTIAHTLGGIYDTPHGLANAVILPVVLEDYGQAVYADLAELYDCAGLSGATGEEGKAKAFIDAIRQMNNRMGIPQGFDFIKDEDIPTMVSFALKECNPLYPVPVIYDKERCRRVIESIRLK